MNEIIELIVIAVIAVVGFTAVYKVVPFKNHNGSKPKLVFFPKYRAKFEKPVEEVVKTLDFLEFKKTGEGIYSRGKIYGDFSAKAIKLAVIIDESEKQIKVCASFFGILFDTGDVWQVTADILNG